jgi:hypothetical protein
LHSQKIINFAVKFSTHQVLNGKMLVFGGGTKEIESQISMVDSGRLHRIGNLNAPFNYGACNTFKDHEEKEIVYLCFSKNSTKTCST